MDYVIVGLGNPGEKYQLTRHNVGWLFNDFFRTQSQDMYSEWDMNGSLNAMISTGECNAKSVMLVKPLTFMNRSGDCVSKIMRENEGAKLLVVHDDVDLPFGKVKISVSRGAGGHNGVLSIMHQLNDVAFVRIRFGVSHVDEEGVTRKTDNTSTFVLKDFSSTEEKKLAELFAEGSEAVNLITADSKGVVNAMNAFN